MAQNDFKDARTISIYSLIYKRQKNTEEMCNQNKTRIKRNYTSYSMNRHFEVARSGYFFGCICAIKRRQLVMLFFFVCLRTSDKFGGLVRVLEV